MRTKEEAYNYFLCEYEPIECSFGGGSVVGDLTMDHHGPYAHLQSVALRAWQLRGSHRAISQFVTTGNADADATFAMLILSGERFGDRFDIDKLVKLIDRMDTDPIGCDLTREGDEGAILLLWTQMASPRMDATSFYGGIDRWRAILAMPQKRLEVMMEAARKIESGRVELACATASVEISDNVLVVLPKERFFGFDVWYERYPVVFQLSGDGMITVGCPNKQVAEGLFGVGGLMRVFGKLEPAGWGGREYVGGSPRGMKMSLEQAIAAAKVAASMIK